MEVYNDFYGVRKEKAFYSQEAFIVIKQSENLPQGDKFKFQKKKWGYFLQQYFYKVENIFIFSKFLNVSASTHIILLIGFPREYSTYIYTTQIKHAQCITLARLQYTVGTF